MPERVVGLPASKGWETGKVKPLRLLDQSHHGLGTRGDSGSFELSPSKTATGFLKWVHDAENKPIPEPGDLSIVTDGGNHPLCIIMDTEIRVVPFEEVDERFAYDGGEGDRTLASWREGYWAMIVADCAGLNRVPTRKAPIVRERFRVVYKEPLR